MSEHRSSTAQRPSRCRARPYPPDEPRHPGRAAARPSRALLAAASAAGGLLASASAHAADVEIESTTAAQAYEVASPWGDNVLQRRRLLQMLSLAVYNLQGKYTPGEADYSVALRLRLDADFGVNGHLEGDQEGGETNFSAGNGERFIPGLQRAPIDLMYAYVEGRNIARGWLGFRAGRQYVSDVLGWWSFDGGLVRVTTPFFVQIELYGGLEQRGGLLLSTPRFERQGIWRGNHANYGTDGAPSAADFPSYQYAHPAPAFGVALESNGPSFVHGRFSYRRVYNLGTSITQQFPDPGGGYRTVDGLRVSQDRLGYAANANLSKFGGLKGGFTYDLYNALVGSFYGGIEGYLGSRVTLGADIDYFVPTFDADSIWNWFTHEPVMTITGRTAIDITPEIDLAASGGARMWTADGDPEAFAAGQCEAAGLPPDCLGDVSFDPSTDQLKPYSRDEENRATTTTTDVLANLSGRYRTRTAEVGLRGMLQTGDRGRRAGGDLSGEKRFDGQRYLIGGRVSLYDWQDPLRPDRDATSFGYVVAAGYRPFEVADFKLEWEHDMNRLVGQRFRIVGVLNLRVAP